VTDGRNVPPVTWGGGYLGPPERAFFKKNENITSALWGWERNEMDRGSGSKVACREGQRVEYAQTQLRKWLTLTSANRLGNEEQLSERGLKKPHHRYCSGKA